MISYDFKTYEELFFHITKQYSNNHFLNYLENGQYVNISVKEFEHKVKNLATALRFIGIKPKDNVAIFARSSPFWLIFDFALHLVGAISVPIFSNISSKNLKFEIKDSKIEYLFIDSDERLEELEELNLKLITHNFCLQEDDSHNLEELFILGENIKIQNKEEKLTSQSSEESLFSVIYTSGNTGTPKGVELTNKNIISQLHAINEAFTLNEEQTALSLLPLAHIYERAVMSYYLSKGMSIYFVDEIENVSNLLKVVRPTTMTVVPRLLEKIFNKIQDNISKKPLVSRFIGTMAFKSAMYDTTKPALYPLYNRLVYSKLREIFGGRIEQLICGGAALDKDIYQFFINIGIPLYQGYGLTEFSPVICTNTPQANKIGSCGKVLPGVEVKLLGNELLAKGNSLMNGYRNQEELTHQTIGDGWLHTGDTATIDEEGYIYITGRKKEIVKTSTGEYVSVIKIEQNISKNRYIEFATVIANNKKYVSCLIFVNRDLYLQSGSQLSIEEFYKQANIRKSVEKTINKVNAKLNKWEQVVQYRFITNEISIEGGELTPSMKICRHFIEQKYEDIINQMYEESSS